MIREPLYSVRNIPESGVSAEIFAEGESIFIEFTKPYALDAAWAGLDELCGPDACWSTFNTITLPIAKEEPLQEQGFRLWSLLVRIQINGGLPKNG